MKADLKMIIALLMVIVVLSLAPLILGQDVEITPETQWRLNHE